MAPLLEARKLAKFYPVKGGARGAQLHAVDEVDLVIGAGESVGLVGESGCGKSTMVRLLARLVDPTSGAIALKSDRSQARNSMAPRPLSAAVRLAVTSSSVLLRASAMTR